MAQDVMVISHRPEMRAALERLFEAIPQTARVRHWQPAFAPAQPPLDPEVAVVDVATLFPRPHEAVLHLLYVRWRRMILMGCGTDADLAMAALNEGIGVHLMEDLTSLAQWVAPASSCLHVYARMGRAYADRIQRVLTEGYDGQPLTRQESHVLELVQRRLSNPQIADALGIQIKTVKNHIGHVYAKLSLVGRHEAMALFARRPTPIGRRADAV